MIRRHESGERPTVVEVAGVAAAGKSTLLQAVLDRLPAAASGETLQLRRAEHWRSIAPSIPSLLRRSLKWQRAGRIPDRTELKLIVYLERWQHQLSRKEGLVVIDQGPVYALARLAHTRPPIPGTEVGTSWWDAMIEQWAATLDVVVWLDASDDELWRRVNARPRHHDIKGAAAAEGTAYLRRYRERYMTVLEAMEAGDGPVVLRYDTGRRTAGDIASDLALRLPAGDGGPARTP